MTFYCFRKIWKRTFDNYILLPLFQLKRVCLPKATLKYTTILLCSQDINKFECACNFFKLFFCNFYLLDSFTFPIIEKKVCKAWSRVRSRRSRSCILYCRSSEKFRRKKLSFNKVSANVMGILSNILDSQSEIKDNFFYFSFMNYGEFINYTQSKSNVIQ